MVYLLRIISYPFLGIRPNVITLFSLLSSVIFFFFLNNHMYGFALVTLSGSVFDAIDGYVARHTGKTSSFGGFFDSVSDRISDFFIIAAFGYAQLVAWEIIAPTILTTFLVSYIRARSEVARESKKMDNGFFKRSGRFVVITSGLVMYLLFPASVGILTGMFLVLIVLNVVTIAQRIYAAYRLLE